MKTFTTSRLTAAYLLAAALTLGACSATATADPAAPAPPATSAEATVDQLVQRSGVVTVAPADAAAVIADRAGEGSFVVLDVRTPEEYAAGHLAGAVNIDFYEPSFPDDIAALDPNATYVVYCRSGNRSGQTAEVMRKLDFAEVYDVSGGIVDWVGAGYSIEQ